MPDLGLTVGIVKKRKKSNTGGGVGMSLLKDSKLWPLVLGAVSLTYVVTLRLYSSPGPSMTR